MKQTLPLLIAALATPVLATETRQLDAHEHGVGELNIAIEGNTIAIELHAPGADIVGFEYAAESAEDRAAIDEAVATLARPLDLFVLPAAAGCSVTQASAELESEDGHDAHDEHDHDHGHEHEHEEHAEKHEDHDHDEHAEKHEGHDHDEHAEAHDEHDHDAHADGASHSEFHAEYVLTCADPEAASEITFAYFDTFENARELEVQVVSAAGAQAFEVMRDAPVLDLRGMF